MNTMDIDGRVDAERRLEALYDAHGDAVLTYLRHRTDAETAGEVLTDTFVIAWRKLDEVSEPGRGWLLAVARRVLANHRRSNGRTAALIDRIAAAAETDPVGAETDGVIARHDVLTALGRLRETDREVLLLAGWYELGAAEAAEALGCTKAAYAVRLHRARRRLRGLLEAPDAEPDPITISHPAVEANR